MTQTQTRRTVLFGVAATCLAGCAPALSPNPLSRDRRNTLRIADFAVATEGAAFANARAADRASALAPDLRQMLRREFADRIAPGGVTVAVDISRMNVASGTATAFGRDQSRLQGAVRVIETDGSLLASYTIIAIAGAPRETRGGAIIGAVSNTAEGYYRALLDQFALQTREEMLGAYLPGERTARRIGGALSI